MENSEWLYHLFLVKIKFLQILIGNLFRPFLSVLLARFRVSLLITSGGGGGVHSFLRSL